ncbi:hypothetical protein ACOMHN_034286 [Nucella lapillus]
MASSVNQEGSYCNFLNKSQKDSDKPSGSISQEVEQYEAALLLLLGFGGISVVLALTYNAVRRYVFRDANSLDTAFDAGGRVTMSLTAVTVGVQLLWPADLLQSATVASTFKTRAPGAKTFLQVIKARYGKSTHLVFCCFALLTNVVIMTAIIISGNDLFQALIKDASAEFSVLIMATLFGSYSFVGGLGSTFYVSYFNAFTVFVLLAVFVIHIFYLPVEAMPFGDLETVYHRISCLQGPEDNMDRSFATFLSVDALVWMVQGVFIASSVTFCDQASWQSRIAAKPMQGVLGFFGATFLWFAVPSTIGTTSAIAYLSFSAGNSSLTLPDADVFAGLVMPYVAQQAMGHAGALLVLTLFTMLMMSTGSGEVMGVSSILVYDVFQSYLYPYKSVRFLQSYLSPYKSVRFLQSYLSPYKSVRFLQSYLSPYKSVRFLQSYLSPYKSVTLRFLQSYLSPYKSVRFLQFCLSPYRSVRFFQSYLSPYKSVKFLQSYLSPYKSVRFLQFCLSPYRSVRFLQSYLSSYKSVTLRFLQSYLSPYRSVRFLQSYLSPYKSVTLRFLQSYLSPYNSVRFLQSYLSPYKSVTLRSVRFLQSYLSPYKSVRFLQSYLSPYKSVRFLQSYLSPYKSVTLRFLQSYLSPYKSVTLRFLQSYLSPYRSVRFLQSYLSPYKSLRFLQSYLSPYRSVRFLQSYLSPYKSVTLRFLQSYLSPYRSVRFLQSYLSPYKSVRFLQSYLSPYKSVRFLQSYLSPYKSVTLRFLPSYLSPYRSVRFLQSYLSPYRCPSERDCAQCAEDKKAILKASGFLKQLIRHNCLVHGHFRTYQDALVRLKSWTIIFVTMAIVPCGLLVIRSGIDLNWVFLTGGIVTVPCFPGTVLSIVWVKATGRGMVIGGITGLICGIGVTLARASSLPGGLDNFLLNTSEGFTVMAGASTSFFVTLFVTIVISLLTHHIKTDKHALAEWQKVRDIDNPLNPWVSFYREEFPHLQRQEKPSYEQLATVFRKAKVTAIVGSVLGLTLFVLFIPGVMASLKVLSEVQFTSWVMSMHVWCFVMAAIVIIVTPLEEIRSICLELKRKKVYMHEEYSQCVIKAEADRGGSRCGDTGSYHTATSI